MSELVQQKNESNDLSYNDVFSAFLNMAYKLGEVYVNGDFDRLLPQFNKYYTKLSKNIRKINVGVLIESQSDDSGVIIASSSRDLLKDKILTARLASMCCVFNNWQVFLHNNIEEISKTYVEHNLSHLQKAGYEQLATEYSKLSLLDAAFVIQLLKQMGLIPVQLNTTHLISFGAAHAQKELYATQLEPAIDSRSGSGEQLLVRFSVNSAIPEHSIFIDNASCWKAYYDELNAKQGDKIYAINNDMHAELKALPASFKSKGLRLRDLVTIWMLDDKMLPDINSFFSGLSYIITNGADFVVTISAEGTEDAFLSRQLKIIELYDYLKKRDMSPVRIALNNNKKSSLFGELKFASFEVLHCKLNPKLL